MNNEPVAYRWKSNLGYIYDIYDHGNGEPLYTHPANVDAVNTSKQYVDKSENNRHDLGLAEAIGFDKGYAAAQAKTQEPNCYGDGNVYRGVRSKYSEIQTIHIDSTAKTLTDEEILGLAKEQYGHAVGLYNHIEFARAILRKAQEK